MITLKQNYKLKGECAMKARLSGIELLKIFAIFLIVISHVSQTATTFENNEFLLTNYFLDIESINSFTAKVLLFFRNFGSIGNIVFVVCSAFFLCESNKSKLNKIIKILFDVWAISYAILILYVIICTILKTDISEIAIFTMAPLKFETNWFINCYLLLLFVHPLLNTIIEKFDNKKLMLMSFLMFILYDIVSFYGDTAFFYNRFLVFCLYYIIVGLLKKNYYDIFIERKYGIPFIAVGIVGIIVSFLTLGLSKEKLIGDGELFVASNDANNPFIFILALGLLNLFFNLKIENKMINKLSSLSLFIYLIHENLILRTELRPIIYVKFCDMLSGRYLIGIVLVMSFAIFIISIFVSYIYSVTLSKATSYFSKKAESFLRSFYKEITLILNRKNHT